MEENSQRGIYKPGLMLLALPECNRLPSLHQDPSACTHIPFFDFKKENITRTCYSGNGQFYQGWANVTASGIPCQKWSDQQEKLYSNTNPNGFLLQGSPFTQKDSSGFPRAV